MRHKKERKKDNYAGLFNALSEDPPIGGSDPPPIGGSDPLRVLGEPPRFADPRLGLGLSGAELVPSFDAAPVFSSLDARLLLDRRGFTTGSPVALESTSASTFSDMASFLVGSDDGEFT